MARKRLGPGGTAKTVGVTLSPVDLTFLEGLAAELAYLRGVKSLPTSEAVRHLISEEKKRKGRVTTDLRPDGTVIRQEAVFEVGIGEGGGKLIRHLDLQTGAAYHMTRTQRGLTTIEDRVEKPKKRKRR